MKSWLPKAPELTLTALLLLGVALHPSRSAAQQSAGFDPTEAAFRRVSNRLLCQCGCNYMVLSCNHLDCPSATYIRKTIRSSLAAGMTEDQIVATFVEQYGAKILPEPPRKGFSWMAWIMPFLALVLGGGAVSYVLWVWKGKRSQEVSAPTPADSPAQANLPGEPDPALVEKYRALIDEELEKD